MGNALLLGARKGIVDLTKENPGRPGRNVNRDQKNHKPFPAAQ